MKIIMAKTNNTVSPAEAVLLELADLIIKTYGNSASTPAAEPEVEEDDAPEVEEVVADEADADSLEEERDELMKLTLSELRKQLIERGFEADDVKSEKSKATLVDALLADLYSDEEDEEEDEDEDPEDDESDEDAADESDEDEDDDDEEEDDDDEEEDDEAYTEEELKEYSLAELKEIATEWELDIKKGSRAVTIVKAILEAQEAAEDEAEDEDEGEDDDELREELEAMTLTELKKTAKNEYGLSAKELKGLDKDAIIDLIFEDDIEDEDDEDEDE